MAQRTRLTAEQKYHLLLEISQKIRGTLDLSEVLQNLIDAVRTMIPYDAAGIFVLNEGSFPLKGTIGSHLIAGMALRGFPERPTEEDPMLRSGKGIVGHVIRTGEPVIVADVRQDPRYVEGRPDTLSEIAVPVTVGGKVIGAVNLEGNSVEAFAPDDAELLQFIANAAAISIEKAVLHQQLLEKKRMERQLEIAREVQAGLLPERPPVLPGYDISALNLPNSEIGGDYFDYIDLPDGRLGVAIADVSGKGVPAALIMATFRAALRMQLLHEAGLSRVMQSVNNLLCDSIGSSSFVTAVFAVLDPLTGNLTYSNCGHNPPLLLRAGGSISTLEAGGMVLGFAGDTRFEWGAETLHPGDMLVLYTDGVVESTDAQGVELGQEGLEFILRQAWGKTATETIKSVVHATRTQPYLQHYADDFTLVIVRREERTAT